MDGRQLGGQVVLLCGHRTGNGTLNERERERDGIYCQQCNTNTQQSTTAGIAGTHKQRCRERRICFDTHDVMILRREKHETGHNNHTKQTQPAYS